MLSWRPSLSQGKMVRADEQSWCIFWNEKTQEEQARYPEGSHRVRPSWGQDRYSWLDEAGRPELPQWQKCGPGIEEPMDMEDKTQAKIGDKIELQSWAADPGLRHGVEEPIVVIDEVDVDLLGGIESVAFLEGVKQQRQSKVIDKLLTSQVTSSDQKAKQRQIARQRLIKAVQVAST